MYNCSKLNSSTFERLKFVDKDDRIIRGYTIALFRYRCQELNLQLWKNRTPDAIETFRKSIVSDIL